MKTHYWPFTVLISVFLVFWLWACLVGVVPGEARREQYILYLRFYSIKNTII